MDKRWILIIIILIAGLGTMYYIVDNSNSVGSAIVTFGKTTITIPENFSVVGSGDGYVELHNKINSEDITIFDYGKGNTVKNNIQNSIAEITKDKEYELIGNSTKKINDVSIYNVDFKFENETVRICGFYNNNHTYLMMVNGYDDLNKSTSDLKFIIDTMVPDYKQKQD